MGFILAIRSRRSPILVRMITNLYDIRLKGISFKRNCGAASVGECSR